MFIVTGVIGSLAAALVVSLVFWRQAVEQKDLAILQSRIALSRQLAANSSQHATADPQLAALLANEAYATYRSQEARRALFSAMQLVVPFTLAKIDEELEATAFSPQRLASGRGGERLADLNSFASRFVIGSMARQNDSILSRNGRYVALLEADDSVRDYGRDTLSQCLILSDTFRSAARMSSEREDRSHMDRQPKPLVTPPVTNSVETIHRAAAPNRSNAAWLFGYDIFASSFSASSKASLMFFSPWPTYMLC